MTRSAAARLVLSAAAGTFFGLAHQAQVGHVVDAQKISDTSGGFTALLDEEDQFGRSIVNLGDVDGDGVTDLLVGAHTDDEDLEIASIEVSVRVQILHHEQGLVVADAQGALGPVKGEDVERFAAGASDGWLAA